MSGYYPLFADLRERRCVVIGGGLIAQRKVTTLLTYGADVTVISPTVTRWLAAYATQEKIRLIRRTFQPKDLAGAWLVYASTNDQRINELVYRTATAKRIFTNVVDQKPLCSFIAPALFRRGALTVAVSTGGASPTIAKMVRRDVGRSLNTAYPPMLRLLESLRKPAQQTLPTYQDRKRYFDRLVNGRVFALVRAGKFREAQHKALALLERQSPSTKSQSPNNHQ